MSSFALAGKTKPRQQTARQAAIAELKEAAMPNTLWWNSVTGQWAAASFGGTLPADGDTVYVDGRVATAFKTSLDRTGDSAAAGLNLSRFEVDENFLGDIGEPSNPLKLGADDFIFRGLGKLYMQAAEGTGWAGPTMDRFLLDTLNVSHEVTLPNNAEQITILRGRARWPVTHSGGPTRTFIGFRDNPESDTIVRIEDSFEGTEVYQFGGQVVFFGSTAGAGRHVLSGGYLQMDGIAPIYIQLGGHCDFGVQKDSGILFPNITTAYLIGGSMDATRAALGQTITTAYISPRFELQEDSKLTITTRRKLWE